MPLDLLLYPVEQPPLGLPTSIQMIALMSLIDPLWLLLHLQLPPRIRKHLHLRTVKITQCLLCYQRLLNHYWLHHSL